MSWRVLFHVQHLLGVGHLKRAELLAGAMAAADLDVTVALGGRALPEAPFAGVRVAQLPPASIQGEDFSALVDAEGRLVDEAWKAGRRDSLLRLFAELEPDVVLIELFPFGRRQFAFELLPLLEAAHAQPRRPRIACSLRDILVASKKPGRDAETIATLRRFFDAVLVHGDPDLVPLDATFRRAAEFADLIHYTGYVARPAAERAPADAGGEVLVSAGGGAVGGPLLLAALAARAFTPVKEHVWRLLTGPNLPAHDYTRLQAAADERTIVERFRADFPARLGAAALSISQAGYNTTMDILRAGVPAVVVPYETAGETEQRLRAELLAAKGVLTVVPAGILSPEALAAAIETAFARPPGRAAVDLDGARNTARLVATLAANPAR